MIRYFISVSDLEARILAHYPGWKKLIEEYSANLDPRKKGPWGEIKEVFMELQNNKCAYCERSPGTSKGDFDVEHYRPKGRVRLWPGKKRHAKFAQKYIYKFFTGEKSEEGYKFLETDFRNYAATCRRCNQTLKSDYFPIAGQRQVGSHDHTLLAKEQPYLLFPVGDLDDNPEKFITFDGVVPIPLVKSGFRNQRARVTIDFFELDVRDDLLKDRAEKISALWLRLDTRDKLKKKKNRNSTEEEEIREHQKVIDRMVSPTTVHTNCAKSFERLFSSNAGRTRATRHSELAGEYLNELSRKQREKEELIVEYVQKTTDTSIYHF